MQNHINSWIDPNQFLGDGLSKTYTAVFKDLHLETFCLIETHAI